MTRWRRTPVAGQVSAAGEAAALAASLVNGGASDAAVLEQLRTVRGGPRALQDAAIVMGRHAAHGYPATRIYRLLRAAADDPVHVPTDEEAAVEATQRQLWEQPVRDSFHLLAEQVAELRQLEQRARDHPESFLRELTARESGVIGGTPPGNPHDRQVGVRMGIDKAVKRLVGPDSGLADPVLSSAAAERAARSHLREVAGIDPA
jgi:hypothetical protein